MNQKPPLRAGCYYHFYNRGVNRQPIFFMPDNWHFFLRRMRHYFKPHLIDVIAYCLMPNHYHLLVYLKCDDISARVMQPFGTSYVKAVNRQQARIGPLFQGAFQARLIDDHAYLTHLTRYIHLNPVEAALAASPLDWPHSSLNFYLAGSGGPFPRPQAILAHFPTRAAYHDFVAGESTLTGPQERRLRAYAAVA